MKAVTVKTIAWLVLSILCSCTGRKADNDVIRVSVLRGPSAVAFAGWMESPPQLDGKQVDVTIFDSPEQIQAAMIKGETEIAVLPMVNAANLYNKDIPYILAGCPLWGTLFIVGREPVANLSVFGVGTTPDILSRHYLEEQGLSWPLDYSFTTAAEVTQAMLMGRVGAAVLSEPFVSIVLQKDTSMRILTDLNHPATGTGRGFAQTAILFHTSLSTERQAIDSLLETTCRFSREHPEDVIRILESRKLFAAGMLTPECLERLRIDYVPAMDAEADIDAFLGVIYRYEPKALGGYLPDRGFITGKK